MAKRTSHLTKLGQILVGERKLEGKERERKERGREEEKETPHFLYFSKRFGRRRLSEHEAKFFLTARASSRDRNRGVSTNSKR